MAEVKYTPTQQKVINIRGKNVLVSAAAGSGKTEVLTARIVDRLCDEKDPVSIDRMLIVTFTEAAASEMRERIGRAIDRKLREMPDNAHLRRQKTLVHSALIMTVHGFCLYLIRNHFESIGLDPSFRVATDEEKKLIQADVLKEALIRYGEDYPDEFEMLTDCFVGGYRIDDLENILMRIYRQAESQPFPKKWYAGMKRMLEDFANDTDNSTVVKWVYEYENRMLNDCILSTESAITLCREPDGPEPYIPALEADIRFYKKALEKKTLKERDECFKDHSFEGLSPVRGDSPLKTEVSEIRSNNKSWITSAVIEKFHTLSFERSMENDVACGAVLKALLTLSELHFDMYCAEKRAKNIIDFSDMEHFALEILYGKEGDALTDVALAYKDFFKEVMVDEYQDSNAIQESLLTAVANITQNEGNRFMVGDVKQSIYRFRLARPEIFREKYDTYSLDDKARDVRIDLSSNFRSRAEVLDSVNKLFEDAMHASVGDVEYDAPARLVLGASYPPNPPGVNVSELMLLPDEDWKGSEFKEKVSREAYAVGARILKMVEEEYPITDKDENGNTILRPAGFSDMVILVRKLKDRAPFIKKVLESMGIPTMVLSKEGYFSTPEINLVLNYISIIDNPRQDIPLLGILHSPFGGFSENEIATIRGRRKNERLYDSLASYPERGRKAELKTKVKAFLDKLNTYRYKSSFKNTYELINELFEKEGIPDYYRALRFGEQREANLKLLLRKALTFSEEGYVGLSHFVRYIDQMKDKEIDFGEVNVLDENANVVRIYTMHKSKGLQFPVCFVLGCGDSLSSKNDKAAVECHNLLGMATDYHNLEKRIMQPSFTLAAIQSAEALERRGEQLRLLYVAMTRAKEKLILTGCVNKTTMAKFGCSGENRSFTTAGIMTATSYLAFLLPEADRNPHILKPVFVKPEESEKEEKAAAITKAMKKEELLAVKPGTAFTGYRYPHKSLAGVFTKTTVSDLKKAAFHEEEEAVFDVFAKKEEACVPLFMREEEEGVKGTTYGTAHHRVMQLMDFSLTECVDNTDEFDEKFDALVREWKEKDFIPKEEIVLVKNQTVLQFMQSDLAKRMGRAGEEGKLYREQPFVLSLPANMVNPDNPEEERVLLQGVIDAYFEEEGELVLMDYKTDGHISEEKLIERYRIQLDLYRMALEKLEKKKVKEVYIYSFSLGKVLKL